VIEFLDDLNAIVASPFVALLLALVAVMFLWRMVDSLLKRIDRQWELIGALTAAQKDSNAITDKALDALERTRA
jgi:hypothetical protein